MHIDNTINNIKSTEVKRSSQIILYMIITIGSLQIKLYLITTMGPLQIILYVITKLGP